MLSDARRTILRQDVGLWVFRVAYLGFLLFSLLGHIEAFAGELKMLQNAMLGLLVLGFVVRLPMFLAREIGAIVGFGIVAILVARQTADYSLVKLVLLLSACKGVPFRSCVKLDVLLRVLLIPTVVGLYIVGIAPDAPSVVDGGVRHSMGFTNPNTFGLACALLCLEILYLNGMKWTPLPVVTVVAILVAADAMAGSRSAGFIIVLGLILAGLNTVLPGLLSGSGFRWCVQILPVIAGVATLVWAWLFVRRSPTAIALNEATSNRLRNIEFHARHSSLKLFGNDLASNDLTLDTAYAYLVLGLGLVVTVCYAILLPWLAWRAQVLGDTPLLIVLFCLLLYGLSERLWMNVDYNILMLCLGYLLYRDPMPAAGSGTGRPPAPAGADTVRDQGGGRVRLSSV